MLQKENVLRQLRDFYRQNAAAYELKRLGLFGSLARDEAGAESDIDVVVEFEHPNLLRQADLMLRLQEMFGHRVDVVALWKRMNPKLRARIEKDVIYV